MNYLTPGLESQPRMLLLLELTKIEEPVKSAVIDHYSKGFDDKITCLKHNIQEPALSRAKKRLEQVASKVEAIKEHDWQNLNT
ncbi:hypothetical protein D5018_03785 [Parashewanella curva]|uniref:Uncharacterized protein n=1 Tax=Parashewanella curva TaxID=2338552 RepID=A0A3L8Q326_9GAMM|nr:hypothetical protein [Parashewanella curva]RLV60972.1 hypothetical protein D5018_03785 [Parashewanella curva]